MKYFIFRNYTIEPFFEDINASFSGYGDISFIDETADAYIWFYLPPYKVSSDIAAKEISNYSNLLELILSRLDPSKPFLIFSMQLIYSIPYQLSENILEEAICQYNRRIYGISENNLNIKIINISGFYRRFSENELIDWRFYFLSQMSLNPKLANDFSRWFLRQLDIVEMKRKKCIVLDLDNTLWGGILGEDGVEGIKIDGDYPGNAYRFFQQYLMELGHHGILLAICSKNNEEDVLEIWEKYPDLILGKDNIVAYKINWNNKADNIKEIASELNIGLDSMVFIDDSPAERELVRQMLPQVTVPDFPDQPYLFPEFIKGLTEKYFSAYHLTREDLSRMQQYKENFARIQTQGRFADFENYLRSLEMELTVEPLDNVNITRISQMTQRTNQFNLTTHRYTEADILDFAKRKYWIYALRVKDCFGDNGLTGLIILDKKKELARIDTFLLSCRILGRNIEDVFMRYMLMKLKNSGVHKIEASYIGTSKNGQVADFYDRIGFELRNNNEGTKNYYLNLNRFEYNVEDLYLIKEK